MQALQGGHAVHQQAVAALRGESADGGRKNWTWIELINHKTSYLPYLISCGHQGGNKEVTSVGKPAAAAK